MTPSDIVKPGATQFTWISSFPQLPGERAGERDDRALARDVVEQERNAAEGRARTRCSRSCPPPRSRIAGTTARQARNIDATLTSITQPPLLERDVGKRAHRERGVETGVVDEDVDRAALVERLPDAILAVSSSEETSAVIADAIGEARRGLVSPLEVDDDAPSSLAQCEPVRDRAPDPLGAAPVTIATLPSSCPITASGEKEVGTRIRFCCVCISGCTPARNLLPAASRPAGAARFSSR